MIDSVTNITMARQGYPRMAMGACFGGPLLSKDISYDVYVYKCAQYLAK